ncbi:MAG: UDP-N-acetylmuramate dehydrogenase [Gemmatimonadetes bacterium]|uniref:UDP-N-acetylenolpyruvoylglucosamine reductase n=1 Tax=Candidatus Kutchimonas denitrificans TaxID=3056748 RepID=A0AAE5C8J9_9BACT|nr:UDP-N-acetylmuramate dehydrogenase [Gemmatimonadota bacterium]NIR74551.1 UDP-N-acetylmuramate dehydrogenase [Candidatus Kutchimonas denitrificans]NIS02741.1 UDP-N-acetylmuramate dehydrogenase [Gemmatimonadota bacterium]NIT68902.1 UDP-N-acetylmuramate dehydrogenase [Gemmatimonadota bacterium]NIU52207.1 UDP-N-acetylmuramate dehydrogenase [Gemmatimonadota bacterium]
MRDVPIADRTRWKIGGPAPAFAAAASDDELRGLLAEVPGQRVLVLGLGANLLVADGGPGAPVLVLEGAYKEFEVLDKTIRCGAAAPISSVVQAARRNARRGLWILEAVPGSMGGALRMNAGTAEVGLWEHTLWAEAMWPDGTVRRVEREDVRPRYRGIDLDPAAIFLRAEIEAPPGDPLLVEREHSRRRTAKLEAQVYDQPTCGSTWKNPAPLAPSAWELVDRVGMRGAQRGGARISTRHANFIVNTGGATAADVTGLMVETRRRVLEETGIALEPEIVFWGFEREVLDELGVTSR